MDRQLAQWGDEKRDLETLLADPATYGSTDTAALRDTLRRQSELMRQIEAVEERWLALHAELEEMDRQA
ncbi:MAG: hypothetical protein MZW92_77190 [Comamonadaceae bacterium]|nr:hypothetical protein [Comamonadaceae bacterium]